MCTCYQASKPFILRCRSSWDKDHFQEATLCKSVVVPESKTQTVIQTTANPAITICDLSPSTNYSVSAAALSSKSSAQVLDSVYSPEAVFTTESISIAFVTTVQGETFDSSLLDINSAASRELKSQLLPLFQEQFASSSSLPFSVTNVTITAFRRGSVVASCSALINSTTTSSVSTDISPVFLSSTVFTNTVTVLPPASPSNVFVSDVRENSILVSFDPEANAIAYDVNVECVGTSTVIVTSSGSIILVENLPANSYCVSSVRALTEATGTAVVYSPFSTTVSFTTAPAVINLQTFAFTDFINISFSTLDRAISYSITTTSETTDFVILSSNLTSGTIVVTQTIGGLHASTDYEINIEIEVLQTDRSTKIATKSVLIRTLDIDECSHPDLSNCDVNTTCRNTDGSFTCQCNEGYTGDGFTCQDIVECMTDTNCHKQADCINTLGSFICTCLEGYTGNGQECSDINECDETPCIPQAKCDNIDGNFSCACRDGFVGDGSKCTDVNECLNEACHTQADCNNTFGSFECVCWVGYTGDGRTCRDINECESSQNMCDRTASCANTPGSYSCACRSGYIGDGQTCTEVPGEEIPLNPCDADPCVANATCFWIEDDAICRCNEGFEGDPRVFCAATCSSTEVEIVGLTFTFNSTAVDLFVYSNEKCPLENVLVLASYDWSPDVEKLSQSKQHQV
ncbi:unnamed protein product [Clavelina lepadiformis]|uniref:Uncharacterized protein n=1 Tax=Clavelina lepadiformis TaxID=159417 RepID=A0ABP0GIU4_CLALP